MVKRIVLEDDAYWKLVELKAKLKSKNWSDFVYKLYDLLKDEVIE